MLQAVFKATVCLVKLYVSNNIPRERPTMKKLVAGFGGIEYND